MPYQDLALLSGALLGLRQPKNSKGLQLGGFHPGQWARVWDRKADGDKALAQWGARKSQQAGGRELRWVRGE